ncbi:MAG: DUF192 domain-containing protein, partial [Thaumarchaeota archaeon]|nr:DUF192 domain-containing protein [Nitrososphaerota archaeon]
MSQKILLCCMLLAVFTIGVIDNPLGYNQPQVAKPAFAQQSSDSSSQSSNYVIPVAVPDWIKNSTGLWAQGKITDSQFVLGIRYLDANGITLLPHGNDVDLQKPIPPWIKNVASWWASGSVSDYEFLSDIQYLINGGEISLKSSGNQTTEQDSNLLTDNFPKGKIKIDNVTLDVQIADTPDRMTEGLQFQQPLSYSQGMIFVFPQTQIVSMWMKDMQFPLDMIWFDSNGNVIDIEKNLPPCSDNGTCTIYNGQMQNAKYVLEVTGGFA